MENGANFFVVIHEHINGGGGVVSIFREPLVICQQNIFACFFTPWNWGTSPSPQPLCLCVHREYRAYLAFQATYKKLLETVNKIQIVN